MNNRSIFTILITQCVSFCCIIIGATAAEESQRMIRDGIPNIDSVEFEPNGRALSSVA